MSRCIVSPADQRSVGPQGQTVTVASRNGHYVAGAGWNICLALSVCSPPKDRAVPTQGQTVQCTRSDSHHVGGIPRNGAIISPADYGAVGAQSQTMLTARGDG